MPSSDLKSEALLALDAAVDAEDAERRGRHVAEAIALLDRLNTVEPAAEVAFLLGYALYLHPECATSSEIGGRAERSLADAVAIDPSWAKPRLYLGHVKYDQRRWAEAREDFVRAAFVDDEHLELKRLEMIVCCEIRMHGIVEALGPLGDLTRRFAEADRVDVHPRNLANAVHDARAELEALGEETREVVHAALRRLDVACGYAGWFSGA